MTSSFYYKFLSVMVLFSCSTLRASDIYYHIKPSMNASCWKEPCLTLSQFAAHIEDYLEQNTTLAFLPGQHSLSLEINITAISKLSMTLIPTRSNSLTATIACEENASLAFSNIGEVCIENLTFSGCHSHRSIGVQMFVVKNSLLLNHRGSALEFIFTTAKLVGSSFIANSHGSYHQFERPTQYNENGLLQECTLSGAALALTQSSVSISACLFKENHARVGGAIFSELNSSVTIHDTSFEQNCANCVGAVLYSSNGSIEVYHSTFLNNTLINMDDSVVSQYGGVFALFESTLQADYCVFENNGVKEPYKHSKGHGGVIYANDATVHISNSEFTRNSISEHGGVMSISNSVCFVTNSRFLSNHVKNFYSRAGGGGGGVLSVKNVNLTIINCTVEENKACSSYYGGVIKTENDRNFLTIIDSNFSANGAQSGGMLYMDSGNTNFVDVTGCEFNANYANTSGGVMYVDWKSTNIEITIKRTKFISNKATHIGGALQLDSVKITLYESVFSENSVQYYGGVVYATHTNLTIVRGRVEKNSANTGIIYTAQNSIINFYNTTFKENTANIATMSLFQSVVILSNITSADNIGSVLIVTSNVTFIGGLITNCSTRGNNNVTIPLVDEDIFALPTYQEGGALTLFQSTTAFKGTCTFVGNHAKIGGAIHATESQMYVYDKITVMHNRALESGGGIYMYRSELNCYINNCQIEIVDNTGGSRGGGVHSVGSTLSTLDSGMINFNRNYAEDEGGGMYIELNSKLYIFTTQIYYYMPYRIQFEHNSANYGGAVYIADETTSGICASRSYKIQSITTECFIQVLSLRKISWNDGINVPPLNFNNNNANISGSNIFGGLLDRCTISPFADREILLNMIPDGIKFLKKISRTIRNLDSVTSKPIRVCFCNSSHQPNCSYHPPTVRTEKGKVFTFELVAVDQVNHTLPNATIRSSLSSSAGGLGEDQLQQRTGESCTNLRFEVFSPYQSEQLSLYADGPCKDAAMSLRKVEIKFLPCTCPIGFQVKVNEKTKCDCECNTQLLPYVTTCDSKTETVARETNFWVDYIGGYLVYPHCPLDYCKPAEDKVKINLNIKNGANIQCANSRTGLLCGTCLSNFSLSLGSSRCIPCPSHWRAITISLTLASAIVGVLFVALLFLLNFSVAVGTLNGIIFYSNVVAANSNAVFPSNIFISWLNLEVGFDICFFEDMDAYWKTWLQLAFPTYLIFLVVMVIFISERSPSFTRLIGRRDSVAALATLVLLSYTKLLNTIIASLSGTVLTFPQSNHSHNDVIVWLPDASVKYFSGKHIPLFVVALFILVAGILYTTLLLFWQCFLRLKLFRWLTKIQKLSLFIQTYHVPYAPEHRYWTGLLLVARIVLYVVSSANVTGNPKINLTAIGVVVASTLILKDFVEYRSRIYQRKYIEILETACHFNILLLCIVTFFTLDHAKISAIIFHVSVSFTAALLVAVLIYHIFAEIIFKTKLWRNYRERQHRPVTDDDTEAPSNKRNVKKQAVIHSIVEIPKQASQIISRRKTAGKDMSEFDGELKVILLDNNEEYH